MSLLVHECFHSLSAKRLSLDLLRRLQRVWLRGPTFGRQVLDACFVCWAIDRDAHALSQPDIAAVFAVVPLPGAVVAQPDGGVAYARQEGAGEEGERLLGGGRGGAYEPPHVSAP